MISHTFNLSAYKDKLAKVTSHYGHLNLPPGQTMEQFMEKKNAMPMANHYNSDPPYKVYIPPSMLRHIPVNDAYYEERENV